MAGSLAFACAANFLGGGNVRSSRAKVSSAVDDLVSVAKGRLLKGARPGLVERLEMCSVVLWQHEEPTKTIQIAVVGVPRRRLRVGLARELGDKTGRRGNGLAGEAFYACPCDRAGGGARLSGRADRKSTRLNSSHSLTS